MFMDHRAERLERPFRPKYLTTGQFEPPAAESYMRWLGNYLISQSVLPFGWKVNVVGHKYG